LPNHIILIGKQESLVQFVHECLKGLDCKYDFIHYLSIDEETPRFFDADLIILDTTGLTEKKFSLLHTLRQMLPDPDLPILALVKDRPVRLRHRVMDLGATDYVVVPFTPLDLRVRITNLLRLKDRVRSESGELNINETLRILQKNFQLISGNILQFNFSHVVQQWIKAMRQILHSRYLFFFQWLTEDELFLQAADPESVITEPWTLRIDDLPTVVKAVRLKEPTILNRVTVENNLLLYLRSILNVNVRSFIIYPIVSQNETRGLLLTLRTDEQPFSEADYRVIQFFGKLFEYAFYLEGLKSQVRESLDNRVWKFSYQFLDRIINQLNFGILVISEELRILYLNKMASDLLGISPEVVTYKRLSDVMSDQNIRTILNSRHPSSTTFERPELVLTNQHGERLLVGFTVHEYKDEEGGTAGYIISLKDITYSKELQEEMRRMERLASLGVMASGIAHEIRNPLAGIKAIAQTFEEELSPDDPKNEYVRRIIRQVNRLDEMLRSLFSYAKPQKPNRQFCQIETILRDVIGLLKQKFREHNIRVTESLYPDLPEIYVDSSQIQQVFMNLILNSIEAIEKDGEIQISILPGEKVAERFSRKPFHSRITEQPYVLVLIRDNGCGISPENLKQIFNPFFTTKTFGTGLGLSIVYQIVKENDGIIYFESELNKGTDCYLFLPAFNPNESRESRWSHRQNEPVGDYK